MAEENFPRGKKKLTQGEDQQKEDVEKESRNDPKRFSRKRQFAEENPFTASKKVKRELKINIESPLQQEILCSNLVTLACVRQVHDYSISISLPGGHIASLPITNISKAYSEKLKEIATQEEEDQSEDLSPTDELFKPGLLIPIIVKDITDDPKKKKKMITTSCDPAHINCNVNVNALQDGMMLIGNISSVEDHGYRIDLGIKGLQTFLKATDAKSYIEKYFNGNQLPVGLPLWCVLKLKAKTGEEIKGSRVLNVTINPELVSGVKIPKTTSLNAILPGMRTSVVVETSEEHGLIVKFFTFQGTIHCSHLPKSAFTYSVGSELDAVVLYVHPENKTIHLSALPHIVEMDGSPVDLFGDLKLGDKMNGSIQRVIRKKGLYLKMSDSHKAFAALSQLSDDSEKPDITKFKHNAQVECRVMGFNFMEGLALVTLKESILKQKYITVNDIQPGDVVQGTITEVLPNGVVVMLSRRIFSFISTTHLSDVPMKHPENKFEEGMKLKCRVMRVDIAKSKVFLSHKKSLLKSKYPIIKDFADLRPHMELEGVISSINPKALHVSFFNNVWGYVRCKEMSTEKVEDPSALFYIGQVVRCRVVYYNVDERKLALSFNLGVPKPERKERKAETESKEEERITLTVGMLYQAKIIRVEKEAFRVSLSPGKTQALLPFCHLSDYHELQEMRKICLKPGQLVEEVTFFSGRLGGIVTMKESFLQAVSEKRYVTSFEELQNGMLLPGVIKNHQDYGVFLELAGGFVGLCPLKTLTEMQPSNLTELLPPGQSVITRISKVDKEKTRFLGSLRKGDCYEGGLDSSLKHLDAFLKSKMQIMKSLSDGNENNTTYCKMSLGSLVELNVTSSHKKGILGDVETGMKALATHLHLGGTKPVVGKKYGAVVLCVDPLAPCLEVSLDHKLIKAVRGRRENSKTGVKPGQVLKADLQLIKTDYMLMSLRGHGAGKFIYVPTKQIINQVYGNPAYKEGMYSDVVIKEVKEDYIMGVLKMNDPEQAKMDQAGSKKVRHNVTIGAVLEARVKNVHELQMNIVTDSGVQGRVHITEAIDSPKEGKHPLHRYQPHDPVKVKVIGLRDVKTQSYLPVTDPKANRTLLECSLKESKMELAEPDKLFSTSLNVSIGDEIFAYILQITPHKVWVQVSPVHQGWVDYFHLSNNVHVLNDAASHFKPNRPYKARVLGTDGDDKLILSFIENAKDIKVGSDVIARISGLKPMECLSVKLSGGQLGMVKENPLQTDYLGQYIQCHVEGISSSHIYELSTVEDRQGPEMEKDASSQSSENSRKRKKAKKAPKSEEQVDSGVDISKASSDSETEKNVSDMMQDKGKKETKEKSTLSIEGFSWSGDLKPKEETTISEDDDGDDDDTGPTVTRKMRRKRKRDEEKTIQEYERNQLEGEGDLRGPSDFDRMVLQSPNSSIVWLRYMAYHVELGEVEKARSVAEKALSTIAFREEQEKKNVWLAYLNLETMYGNKDEVKKVLERAVAYNDPVEIYLKMCDIYVGADKPDDAEQLYHIITRKFKKDKSVWKSYCQFLYKAGRLQVARTLLQRCLTALDKKDHVEVISRFANLEFAHGDTERGRTMFENLIASYPGRTDIWSVYIDMVTKAGDIDSARQLLERAVKQKLNTKKLTFLVQKFIKFEETYGTEERVEKVKDLAITLFET